MKIQSLCVYCGSNPGARPEYFTAARSFGELLAARGITLVYGGGKVGLMGAVADGALARGGRVVGVIPESLMERELGHIGVTELHAVRSMHERKMKMAESADAFVALPGGIGTLEEILEVYTWNQLGLHHKPCALLDIAGFYRGLVGFLETLVEDAFLKEAHLASLLVETDPERLLERLEGYRHTDIPKWLSGEPEHPAPAA